VTQNVKSQKVTNVYKKKSFNQNTLMFYTIMVKAI